MISPKHEKISRNYWKFKKLVIARALFIRQLLDKILDGYAGYVEFVATVVLSRLSLTSAN